MTARRFLQNQFTQAERSKLGALPAIDALSVLFDEKQRADASLNELSGQEIGTKGLDILAASTAEEAKAELNIEVTDVEGLEDGLSGKADNFDVLNGGTF